MTIGRVFINANKAPTTLIVAHNLSSPARALNTPYTYTLFSPKE